MALTKRASVGWVRDMEDLRGVLRSLPADLAAELLEVAVKEACQPILVAAKRLAKRSERTGALRESLVIKTVAYPRSGKAVGLVGPDRKYYVKGARATKLSALFGAAAGKLRRPANYAHLIEYGHRVAHGGTLRDKHEVKLVGIGLYSSRGKELKRWKKGKVIRKATGTVTGFVPPKPFLRPAVVMTRGQQSTNFQSSLERGFARKLSQFNRAAGTRVRYKRAA